MKSLGMGITAAVFLLGLAGFVLFRASRVEVQRPWPLQQSEAEKLSLPGPVAASLALASLAPSTHNTQPWKVRVLSESEMLVLLDEKRLLPAVDPDRREALVSIGAFLENLVRGAAAQGLTAKVEITVDDLVNPEVARVHFEPASQPGGKEILGAILDRSTFRGTLPTTELPEESVRALKGTAPSRWTYFPAESPGGAWIREALNGANRSQASRDDAMEELASWIRFSPKAVERHKDGLSTAGMGLPPVVRAFMALFFSEKSVTGQRFREAGVKTARKQAGSCSGFFVLESPDGSPRSAVQAGRDLEAFWLEAVRLGIAVHPMSQVLEESPWKDQIASRLGIRKTVQSVLRVGLATTPSRPVSPRRPLESFVERP